MTTIKCNNSDHKAVSFFPNGGINILVMAMQDGEYWFSIGNGYKNEKTAKRAAVKEFAKHGYTFDAKEMGKFGYRINGPGGGQPPHKIKHEL